MQSRTAAVMSVNMLVWSALFAMSSSAKTNAAADHVEKPSLEVEERNQEAADQADRVGDKAVRMLDRVIIKTRPKPAESKAAIHDTWLTAKAKLALVADDRIKGRQMTVETQNGVVSLQGAVFSNEAKAVAEEIVNGVDGVKQVKNALQVVTTSETKVEGDQAITERVTAALKKDPKLKKVEMTVRTDDGIVTLTGSSPDLLTSSQAAWTAWKVKGVRMVNTELAVKTK